MSAPYLRPPAVLARVVNPVVVRLGLGTVLVVRGRRSGRLISVPIGQPLALDGQRYLVSGRGTTHWIRNLRAAGEGTLRSRGRSERFRAVELTGAERDRVVAAYREHLGRSGERYFTEIPDPADHPVIRMEPYEPRAGAR